MKEDQLQTEVLIPLFKQLGYRDVYRYHGGPLELGKDIVMWREDPLGCRENYAVVVKAGRISGKAMGSSSAGEVSTQVQQAFGMPFSDPITGSPQRVDKCIVVSSKEINKEAIQAITAALKTTRLDQYVQYINGEVLWERVKTHLPEVTLFEQLENINTMLSNANENYNILITTGAGSTSVMIQPKHPGATDVEPINVGLRLKFPSNEEGQRALDAMKQHIETGAPVSLGNEFIEDFSLPPFLLNVLSPLGSTVHSVELGPTSSTHKILVRPEITAADGTVAALGVVELEAEQVGSREITLSNQSQPVSYKLRLVINQSNRKVKVHIDAGSLAGINCRLALQNLMFFRSFAKGGVLHFVRLDSGLSFLAGPCLPGQCKEPDSDLIELLENLSFIQERARVQLDIPERPLSLDEAAHISETAQKIGSGRISVKVNNWTATTTAQDLPGVLQYFESGVPVGFRIEMEETQRIFEQDVPMGVCVVTCPRTIVTKQELARLQDVISKVGPTDDVQVTFTPFQECTVELEYPRWLESSSPR